jgi:AraC-like DNA-binding protein
MIALSEILHTKLIPWTQHDARKRFIVARAEMRESELPSGVRLKRRDFFGKRVVVKKHRSYNNTRNMMAEWPDMGLYELAKYNLVCVLDGNIDYQLGHYSLQCGPGQFIFIPPGTPHPSNSRSYVGLQKSASCEFITFLLHPNALECWTTTVQPERSEDFHRYLFIRIRLVTLFHALMEEVVDNEESALLVSEKLLSAFFYVLQRELNAGRAQQMRSPHLNLHDGDSTVKSPSQDFAARLERYVLSNLSKPLTLNRAARDLYLSPAQFARKVRRETGGSFRAFLTKHRLEEAKRLLRTSRWNITSIARSVGFQSSSYFCAFFKQHTGETPARFRERFLR